MGTSDKRQTLFLTKSMKMTIIMIIKKMMFSMCFQKICPSMLLSETKHAIFIFTLIEIRCICTTERT